MKALVRAVFAAVVLTWVAEVGVTAVLGPEPYPALYQPAFGGAVPGGGVAVTRQPAVLVTYADGSEATYDHDDVMAASPYQRASVFRSAFGPESPRRTHPENVRWLVERVTALGGGREPVEIVLEDHQITRELGTRKPPQVVVTARDTVDLGSARA